MTMLKKDDELPWISPMIVVKDVDVSLKNYEQAFGFEPGGTMQDDDGKTNYASMTYKGQMILMLMPEQSWGSPAITPSSSGTPTPINLYVYCDNVDKRFKQAKQAGTKVLEEPTDMFWGDRVTRLQDENGYTWSFATKVGEYQLEETVTA